MPKRGPKISPTVKELVRYTALRDKRPRRVVAVDLQKQIESIEEPIPEVETLERLISSTRNHAPDEEDNPWHVSTIVQYPIPFETLSTVLKVWASALLQDRKFTIREAKWVARLHHVFKDAGRIDDIPLLTGVATDYALFEKAAGEKEKTSEKAKEKKSDWVEDAWLFNLLYHDTRPMDKITSNLKWRKLTDAEAEAVGLPEIFKSILEARNERPHSQKIQE